MMPSRISPSALQIAVCQCVCALMLHHDNSACIHVPAAIVEAISHTQPEAFLRVCQQNNISSFFHHFYRTISWCRHLLLISAPSPPMRGSKFLPQIVIGTIH